MYNVDQKVHHLEHISFRVCFVFFFPQGFKHFTSTKGKHVNKLILSRDAKIKFYTTFIRPVFEYCCELWNGCRAELTERLEHPQLAIDRIVTGLPS